MDISSKLKDFGLTDYESRVYTALLGLKQAKVSDIAKNCSVPRNKIYSVAESLHKKGFVEIVPEKVAKFRAVPFEEATQAFIKEQEGRLKNLEENAKKISAFLSSFAPEKKEEDSSGEFLVYKTKKMIYKKLNDIILQAQSRIFIAASWEDVNRVMPALKAVSKKVDVKILCNLTGDNLEMCMKSCCPISETRHYEKNLPEKIVVVDDKEALVFQANSPVALYSKDPQFVAFMKRFMNMILEDSVSVEERVAEIETGVPREEVKIFRGVENIYDVARKASSSAKNHIMRIATEGTFNDTMKHGIVELEKRLSAKGVKIRYILPITEGSLMMVKEAMKFAEVRHMDFIPMQLKIVDDAYCSMRQWESIEKEPVNIVSTSPDFIVTMKHYFEKVWSDSIPAEKRIAGLLLKQHVKKETVKSGIFPGMTPEKPDVKE
ncbi:MAG: hypothetical protein HYW26_05095 [Candidatus Aenigmarchaeota archaeon]|nr:hypothetical protein [Candidatus Aenigmarchaeota archaeon]